MRKLCREREQQRLSRYFGAALLVSTGAHLLPRTRPNGVLRQRGFKSWGTQFLDWIPDSSRLHQSLHRSPRSRHLVGLWSIHRVPTGICLYSWVPIRGPQRFLWSCPMRVGSSWRGFERMRGRRPLGSWRGIWGCSRGFIRGTAIWWVIFAVVEFVLNASSIVCMVTHIVCMVTHCVCI